jgi:glucosylglycerol-phosphate synthase
MKSSLVILYHREPYDEVVVDGKTIYRDKKSPNGIVPTLKTFFANARKQHLDCLETGHQQATGQL